MKKPLTKNVKGSNESDWLFKHVLVAWEDRAPEEGIVVAFHPMYNELEVQMFRGSTRTKDGIEFVQAEHIIAISGVRIKPRLQKQQERFKNFRLRERSRRLEKMPPLIDKIGSLLKRDYQDKLGNRTNTHYSWRICDADLIRLGLAKSTTISNNTMYKRFKKWFEAQSLSEADSKLCELRKGSHRTFLTVRIPRNK
jgi:hypothetical protein